MKRNFPHNAAALLLASMAVIICMSACEKETGNALAGTVDPIAFSASASVSVTKASARMSDEILGYWNAGTSSYNPGKGLGVFAFYQKAKSNGYPVYFSGKFTTPDYMSNQRLERTSTDGATFTWRYSPEKYWPNNTNDQLSFFAYAPYDESTAWEDMEIKASLDGTKVTRHYTLAEDPEEQEDFIWAEPVLNRMKSPTGENIVFDLRHICAKLAVSCRIDVDNDGAYITVDKVVVSASFNSSGDIIFRTADSRSKWENLERPEDPVDYLLFRAKDAAGRQRVTKVAAQIGGKDSYMFPFPGTQDIVITATLIQNNSDGTTKSAQFTKTLPGLELMEGQAYNILLDLKASELTF